MRFVDDQAGEDLGRTSSVDSLTFEPAIGGQLRWEKSRELVFSAEKSLEPGQHFLARLNAAALPKALPELDPYQFHFTVLLPDFEITAAALESDGASDSMTLPGTLEPADGEPVARVEQMLSAHYWRQRIGTDLVPFQ